MVELNCRLNEARQDDEESQIHRHIILTQGHSVNYLFSNQYIE